MEIKVDDFVEMITLAVEDFNDTHKYEKIESILNDDGSVDLHYEDLANNEYSIFEQCKSYEDLHFILGESLDYAISECSI